MTIAVVTLSVGALAFAAVTMVTVWSYIDSVNARERRVQRDLNQQSCADIAPIIHAKDYFWHRPTYLADFECTIDPT